jgi:dephospho-CoA kinase
MIIGIIGKKGVGKDTLVDYLISKYNIEKYSFADPLKKTLIELFCLKEEQVYQQDLKEVIDSRWGITPREMMQIFGTEIIQKKINEFFPTIKTKPRLFWVQHFINTYQERIKTNPNLIIIISDVRFIHEVEAIKEIGGKLIRLTRPNKSDNDNQSFSQHSSETELDNYHMIDNFIINDGDIKDLYKKGSNIIEEIISIHKSNE